MPSNFKTMMMSSGILHSYMTRSDFDKFGFRFEEVGITNTFILKCAAFDTSKNIIEKNVPLITDSAASVSLEFGFKSVLILSKEKLASNGFDGSFNMNMIPQQSEAGKPYVSYWIDGPAPDGFAKTAFGMNPSPPYNP